MLVANGGEATVPKYTSQEVAPLDAIQLNTGIADTPVAPFAGQVSTGVGGAATCVVNDQIAEAVEPPAFFATTYQ